MGKIRYGVIGSGWRAEFYIRIAKAVPDKFEEIKKKAEHLAKNSELQLLIHWMSL